MSNATIKSYDFLLLGAPPWKNCSPQTIAPQKVFLGGRRKHHFQSLCLVLPKTAATAFQIITFTGKNSIQDQFGSMKNCTGKKIRSLQHFTLKLVILVPFSKRDSFFFNKWPSTHLVVFCHLIFQMFIVQEGVFRKLKSFSDCFTCSNKHNCILLREIDRELQFPNIRWNCELAMPPEAAETYCYCQRSRENCKTQ